MLTLARAESPTTCSVEQRAQAGLRPRCSPVARSLQRTLVSFPLTRSAGCRAAGNDGSQALPMLPRGCYSIAHPPQPGAYLSR
jgi:hypothetical protein